MGSLSALLATGSELPRVWAYFALGVRALTAAFFLFLAWKNLSGDAQMVADFKRWGYPEGFRQFTAWLQVVGAIALVPPQTCFWGGGLLAFVLLGALGTHLLHDPWKASASPLIFLVVVLTSTAWFRPDLMR